MTDFAGLVTICLGFLMTVFFGIRVGVRGTVDQKVADVCLAAAGACALFTGLSLMVGP